MVRPDEQGPRVRPACRLRELRGTGRSAALNELDALPGPPVRVPSVPRGGLPCSARRAAVPAFFDAVTVSR